MAIPQIVRNILFGGASDLIHWVQSCGAMVRCKGAMARCNGAVQCGAMVHIYWLYTTVPGVPVHCTTAPVPPHHFLQQNVFKVSKNASFGRKKRFGSNLFGAVQWVHWGTLVHCTAPSHHCTIPAHYCTVPSHHCTVPSHHTRTMTSHHCTTYIVPVHTIIAPPFVPLTVPQRQAL